MVTSTTHVSCGMLEMWWMAEFYTAFKDMPAKECMNHWLVGEKQPVGEWFGYLIIKYQEAPLQKVVLEEIELIDYFKCIECKWQIN